MADFVAQRRNELYGKERHNKTEAENLKKVLESTHVLKSSGEYNYDPQANVGVWQSSHSLDFKVSTIFISHERQHWFNFIVWTILCWDWE